MSPKLGHVINDVLLMAEGESLSRSFLPMSDRIGVGGSEEFFPLRWEELAPPVPDHEPETDKQKAKKKRKLKTVDEIAEEAQLRAAADGQPHAEQTSAASSS